MQNTQQNHKLILGYWAIRGLAQRIRMILQYLNLPYEEVRYSNQEQDKWFNQEKPKLKHKNPAINLPYLMDGDKIITQSDAIIVYICYKANRVDLLIGSNCEEHVLASTVMGIFRDYHKHYVEFVYGKKEDFENQIIRKCKFQAWGAYLKKLDQLLQGKEYFSGRITWVDFVIAENMQALTLMDTSILAHFQNIRNHQKRIWDLPALKAYHSSNRYHERPINYNPDACWY